MVDFVARTKTHVKLAMVTTPGFYVKPHLRQSTNVFFVHIIKEDSSYDKLAITHITKMIFT